LCRAVFEWIARNGLATEKQRGKDFAKVAIYNAQERAIHVDDNSYPAIIAVEDATSRIKLISSSIGSHRVEIEVDVANDLFRFYEEVSPQGAGTTFSRKDGKCLVL
jgi:hypothetical protein